MDVIWRDIKGFEGRYQVSNCGDVKSLGRRLRIGTGYRMTKDCILHPMENKYGYLYVTLDGRNTNVHRLVAMAFLPIIDGKQHVNHIDGKKYNNNVCNLEFVTPKENMQHALKSGLRSKPRRPTNLSHILSDIDLANIRISHKNKEMTQIELANKYSVSRSHIQYILNFKGRFSWQKPVQ